ncbi:hypothetical protein C7999DRAFT_15892 [Corynascus novoguineensis]|uniref:Uncharacterized protein n=1 Tax=Corynascus novoguineensis TaxID=1126955 RepID=A0AAN7HDK0_9PEZI|nr:hypothetical protein C7999DRAFT_15892 [Corynascus novoguineensis]
MKCTRCTYLPTGHMLKCCGFCGGDGKPAGQRKCTTCNGTGKGPVAIRYACEEPHKRDRSITLTTGAPPSPAGRGGPSGAGRGGPSAAGRGGPGRRV